VARIGGNGNAAMNRITGKFVREALSFEASSEQLRTDTATSAATADMPDAVLSGREE
jgi:hypothetical protein